MDTIAENLKHKSVVWNDKSNSENYICKCFIVQIGNSEKLSDECLYGFMCTYKKGYRMNE